MVLSSLSLVVIFSIVSPAVCAAYDKLLSFQLKEWPDKQLWNKNIVLVITLAYQELHALPNNRWMFSWRPGFIELITLSTRVWVDRHRLFLVKTGLFEVGLCLWCHWLFSTRFFLGYSLRTQRNLKTDSQLAISDRYQSVINWALLQQQYKSTVLLAMTVANVTQVIIFSNSAFNQFRNCNRVNRNTNKRRSPIFYSQDL